MGEGGEIVEVCTVDLKCLKELLNRRGHEVRKEHEEIAERKKSVRRPLISRFDWSVKKRPAKGIGLAVKGNCKELREKPSNCRDGHVKTMFHRKRWKFEGFRQ